MVCYHHPLILFVSHHNVMAHCYHFVLFVQTCETVYVFLFSGPYNLCLPAVHCPRCSCTWTPGVSDLISCRYWPATASCQMLFRFDVFSSFEEMKLASPATSQKAFIRMLEHRAHRTGRVRTLVI